MRGLGEGEKSGGGLQMILLRQDVSKSLGSDKLPMYF